MDGNPPSEPDMEALLTPDDVAGRLIIAKKTLYQWRYKGIGPPGHKFGGHLRYFPEEFEKWLRQQP